MNNMRETAIRIFADEFNRSNIDIRGEGEYSPNYVISPLGAKMNRVYIVGVLIDVENRGDEDEPFYRARVTDTMGNFFLASGQFNPEATAVLGDLAFPTHVAVVGKVRSFEPEDGGLLVSISPEVIKEVDDEIRDHWCVETAKSTIERIKAHLEAKKMHEPTVEKLTEVGFSRTAAESALLSLENYDSVDTDAYFNTAVSALYTVVDKSGGEDSFSMPDRDGDREYRTSFESDTGPATDGGDAPEEEGSGDEDGALSDEEMEQLILDLIGEVNANEPEKDGGSWDEILALSAEKDLTRKVLNETMERLYNKGVIFEPIVGRIKKV